MNTKLYLVLMLVTLVAAIAGVLTLVPASGASYPNILGYRSLCTFAPAATLYCFGIAGISCVIRASLVKRKGLYGKATFSTPAIAVVAFVLVLAVGSTFWFTSVKGQYTDVQTSATEAMQ